MEKYMVTANFYLETERGRERGRDGEWWGVERRGEKNIFNV